MTNAERYWKKIFHSSSEQLEKNTKKFVNFHRIEMIETWTKELAQSKKIKDFNHWASVGCGILYLTDNLDDGEMLTSEVAKNAGFNFISISKHEVMNIVKHKIPKNTLSPCLIYLEPGEWMKAISKNKSDTDLELFQRKLQNLIADFDPNFPVVFTTSVKRVTDIDELFRTAGVFDRRFEISDKTLMEKGYDFINQIGLDICDESITNHTDKVGKLVECQYDNPRLQGLISIALKRTQKKLKRKLKFFDLIEISCHGSGECDVIPMVSKKQLNTIAIHEAGHVTASILDSEGLNIPEYASAFPGRYFSGITVDSYRYMTDCHGLMTYRDYEHKIRVYLAGRIAEHFILGIDNITVHTSNSDFEIATSMCQTMFGFSGISADSNNVKLNSNNLAVIIETSTASEEAHIENLTRHYLKKQYEHVFNLFSMHRKLLEKLVNCLKQQRVLTQNEIMNIYKVYERFKNKKVA